MTKNKHHEELPSEHHDPLIEFLHRTIRIAVKILAVLMVFVIVWGIGDVIYMLYQRLMTPPLFLFTTVRLSKLYLRLHELPEFERFSFMLSRGNQVNHRLTLE